MHHLIAIDAAAGVARRGQYHVAARGLEIQTGPGTLSVHAVAGGEVDVTATSAREDFGRLRQCAVHRLELRERVISAVPRIDVEHRAPRRRRRDVRVGAALPPTADHRGIGRGVFPPMRHKHTERVFAGVLADSVSALTTPPDDAPHRKHRGASAGVLDGGIEPRARLGAHPITTPIPTPAPSTYSPPPRLIP